MKLSLRNHGRLYSHTKFNCLYLTNLFKDILLQSKEAYISSGETDPRFFGKVEKCIEEAAEKGVKIEFLVGPVVCIPETQEKSQEKRAVLNPVGRMAKEGVIELYPSKKRPYIYGVFLGPKEFVIALEEYDLLDRPRRAWVYENNKAETKARNENFSRYKSTNHPIFLTPNEILELKTWARKRESEPSEISWKEVDNFCKTQHIF